MIFKDMKEIYIYPCYGLLDVADFNTKQRRIINKLHPNMEIVIYQGNSMTNFSNILEDNSVVYMDSILQIPEILQNTKCIYKTPSEIKNNDGKFYSFYLYFDAIDLIYKCYLKNIYFCFDKTPFCNTDNIINATHANRIDDIKEKEAKIKSLYFKALPSEIQREIFLAKTKFYYYEIAREDGKKVGHSREEYMNSPKTHELISKIRILSKDFEGKLTDTEVLKNLSISRNTLKKYKEILKVKDDNTKK